MGVIVLRSGHKRNRFGFWHLYLSLSRWSYNGQTICQRKASNEKKTLAHSHTHKRMHVLKTTEHAITYVTHYDTTFIIIALLYCCLVRRNVFFRSAHNVHEYVRVYLFFTYATNTCDKVYIYINIYAFIKKHVLDKNNSLLAKIKGNQ